MIQVVIDDADDVSDSSDDFSDDGNLDYSPDSVDSGRSSVLSACSFVHLD